MAEQTAGLCEKKVYSLFFKNVNQRLQLQVLLGSLLDQNLGTQLKLAGSEPPL